VRSVRRRAGSLAARPLLRPGVDAPTESFMPKVISRARRGLRIVVPSTDDSGLVSQVSPAFSRCPFFTLLGVEDGTIVSVEVHANPHREDHTPELVPAFVRSLRAEVVIAASVGLGARALLSTLSISLLSGASGEVGTAARSYLAGSLRDVAASTGGKRKRRSCACPFGHPGGRPPPNRERGG
jgi:predicted Fe-Mo cluster-binding NifX family protein